MSTLIDFVLHIDEHLMAMVANYGVYIYAILFLIVFVETGLIVMPLLPGDSLLFAAGAIAAANNNEGLNVWVIKPLLILGTGGASKAVAYVLRKWGIPFHFVSRTPQGEQEMGYDVLKAEVIHHFPLIINTTPLGTYPDIDACPYLPYEGLSEKHFLYDLIYNPEETTFLRLGRLAGAKTMNGHAMLIKQAEKSWEIWNRV